MQVVMPVAGKGTRLRPHTHVTPKPLLRVGDKPVLSYLLDDLQDIGVRQGVFITGHLKEKLEEYVRTEYPNFQSTFIEQKTPNGTAAAVELAIPHVQEDLLIIFVDTLFDADLSLVHRLPAEADGVIWVKEVEDYQRFGVVLTDEHGYMTKIVEKPKEPISKLANIGLYYIRNWKLLYEGIQHVRSGEPGKGGEYFLTDAFQYMIERGAKILTAEVDGWYDAGEERTLRETNAHVLATTRQTSTAEGPGVTIHHPVHIANGAIVEDAEIGPHVTIGAGTTIRGSKLRDVIVGANTVIEASTLHESLIGDRVRISGMCGRVNVGDDSVLEGLSNP